MTRRRRAQQPRMMWQCHTCTVQQGLTLPLMTADPCRQIGHRSERMQRAGMGWRALEPRSIMEAVQVTNGVALVPVGQS